MESGKMNLRTHEIIVDKNLYDLISMRITELKSDIFEAEKRFDKSSNEKERAAILKSKRGLISALAYNESLIASCNVIH